MKQFSILRLPGVDVLISSEDAPRVIQHRWHVFKSGRKTSPRTLIATRINGKHVKIHRFIMGATAGSSVDHINGLTLDNRRENLRLCSQSENALNRAKQGGTKNKFKGVYQISPNCWQVKIGVLKRRVVVGYFPDEITAAKEYDRAALIHHGAFARTNFPQQEAA